MYASCSGNSGVNVDRGGSLFALAVPVDCCRRSDAGAWAFADAREKALREREAQPTSRQAREREAQPNSRQAREREAQGTGQVRDRGLGVGIYTVAEVQIQEIGVDAVDPRVLPIAGAASFEPAPFVSRVRSLTVAKLDRIRNRHERRWMPPVIRSTGSLQGLCAVGRGEYGATVRDGSLREQTRAGEAVDCTVRLQRE